nr:PREDICTED: uncharacterized protein LOC107077321 isoform X1 [Lepisosteus oculatus]
MFLPGSQMVHFDFASGLTEHRSQSENIQQTKSFKEFLVKLKRVIGGLRKDSLFCSLRVPNQYQTAKEEIDLVILTGRGIFCIDVKSWKGEVSVQRQNWHVHIKEQEEHFTNTSITQMPDPVQAIKNKTANLWSRVVRSGVAVHQSLFIPWVVFLSPDCILDEDLQKTKEVVTHGGLDSFFHSFKEGYLGWLSDAFTPSLLSGHLSYRQIASIREVLKRTGTWDTVSLHGGGQLKGDYRGCQHLALSREETDVLEFSHVRTLSAGSLWVLLGYSPKVTVKMYKRGRQGWLGRPLTSMATIPYNTHISFRVCGEDADAKIPANHIDRIHLSL